MVWIWHHFCRQLATIHDVVLEPQMVGQNVLSSSVKGASGKGARKRLCNPAAFVLLVPPQGPFHRVAFEAHLATEGCS